jgi:hypothetical protein
MERHSCSMPCLTKAWRRTLPNVACDSEAIAVVGPTRKARRIKPSVSVVFIHSDHLLDTRSGESQASWKARPPTL